jgi:hypothetical protein
MIFVHAAAAKNLKGVMVKRDKLKRQRSKPNNFWVLPFEY